MSNKEKLYWVRNNKGKSLLYKDDGCHMTTSGGYGTAIQENFKSNHTFTEKEIKDYDECYWPFAILVEDDDEQG